MSDKLLAHIQCELFRSFCMSYPILPELNQDLCCIGIKQLK